MSLSLQRPLNSQNNDEEAIEMEARPSLLERLHTSKVQATHPPVPKPFDMSEPFQQPGGLWCFWLAADDEIIHYVAHLSCIVAVASNAPFARPSRGRVLFGVNPRYEYEEAWMWVYRLLETETKTVELSDMWFDALDDENEIDGYLGS